MDAALNVLLIEDSPDDAELILRELQRGGYAPRWRRVDTAPALAAALAEAAWDIVLCDYVMPRLSGPEALRRVREHDPDLPVILVSGEVSQTAAVESMRAGARDYVMKGDLARLVPAVTRELAEARRWREEQQAVRQRRDSERQVAGVLIRLAAAGPDDIDACVTDALRSVAGLARADRSYVFLVTGGDGGAATLSHSWSDPESRAEVGHCMTMPAAAPWWWGELHALRPIILRSLDDLPAAAAAERAQLQRRGVRAIAAVPLADGGALRGFLGLSAERDLPLRGDDLIALFRVVGEITLGALDRVQAERALRESERRYRDLVENLSEVIYTVDPTGVITYASPVVEVNSGYRPEELIGRPFAEFIHPDDIGALQASFRRVLAGKPEPSEYRVIIKSGAERWVRSSSRPIFRDGVLVGLQAVLSDITDLKQSAEQRELLDLLTAQAPVGIVLTDAAAQVTAMNPIACDILGSPSEEASKALNVLTVPAVRDAHIDGLFRAAIEQGQRSSAEARYRSHWGKESFIRLQVAPLYDASGHVRGTVAVIEDTTQRVQAEQALREREERLRSLIDGLGPSVLVGLMTPDGRVVEASRSALELSELRIEDVRGGAVADLPLFASSEAVRQRLRESIGGAATEGRSARFEARVVFPTAGERIVDLSVEPLRDVRGAVIYVIGTGVDVTERVRAQEGLARLNEELEHRVAERTTQLADANRELEAFTSSVSHDLQAPLRAIRGFSHSLLAEAAARLDGDVRGDLERIHAAAERLQQLIDALLELARVAHCELRRAPVDLSQLARAQAAELQRAEPRRSVSCTIADGLVVDGDQRLLRVVIANLLGNAWKYTATRTRAHIELTAEERGGERVYVVRDDGVGFDPAAADQLFVPFRRLHGAEFAGSGVGLSTVARIVHRHGGRIWAEAQPDRGARFYFTIGSAPPP